MLEVDPPAPQPFSRPSHSARALPQRQGHFPAWTSIKQQHMLYRQIFRTKTYVTTVEPDLAVFVPPELKRTITGRCEASEQLSLCGGGTTPDLFSETAGSFNTSYAFEHASEDHCCHW